VLERHGSACSCKAAHDAVSGTAGAGRSVMTYSGASCVDLPAKNTADIALVDLSRYSSSSQACRACRDTEAMHVRLRPQIGKRSAHLFQRHTFSRLVIWPLMSTPRFSWSTKLKALFNQGRPPPSSPIMDDPGFGAIP